jgi:flagellar assembly protein FliH
VPQSIALPNAPAAGGFEIFQYPASSHAPILSDWECWTKPEKPDESASAEDPHAQARAATEAALRSEYDKRLAEEVRKAFEVGGEKGRLEGRQAEHAAQATVVAGAVHERTRQAAELIDAFTRERDRLFHAVEHEVVDLALAVAARILRREAQMDPLLLTGAVRVALGQLSASTKVTLKVPPAELDLWTEAMALLPNLAVKPTVVAGEGMRLGDCQVETALGSVDLGIRSQLGEIERGFFDRAGGRKTESATSALMVSEEVVGA